MLVGRMTVSGKETVLIGLSRKNTELLLQGKPIYKDTELPINLLIIGGETEDSILEHLKEHLNIPDGVIERRS